MANILNIEKRALSGKNRVLKNYDTCIHVDDNGKILFGVVMINRDTYSKDNIIPRPDDGQLTDTEGTPIFRTVPILMFPESETQSFASADIYRIVDRLYLPGDFVKRNGRLGFILKVRQTASARIIEARSKYQSVYALYVYNKPREQFWNPMQEEFKAGALFHRRGWIGKVTTYNRDVVLNVFRSQEEFSFRKSVIGTGKICRVYRKDLVELHDFKNDSLNMNSRRKVYPGIILKLAWGPFSKINPHWESEPLTQPRSAIDIVYAEVLNIEVTSVKMSWLKQIPGTSSPKPKKHFRKAELNELECIAEKKELVLGDLMMCRMEQNTWEQVFTKAMWQNVLARNFHLHRRVCKRPYPRDDEVSQPKTPKALSENVPVEIMETKTEVDVEWLDGVVETTPALNVNPIRHNKLTKTPIGALVCLRTERTNTKKFGVVQSVRVEIDADDPLNEEIFMIVQWFRISDNLADPPLPDGPVQEVLSFDLNSSYLRLYSGDVVITNIERNNENFLFGEVIATLTDGRVRVRGSDGTIYRIWPNHVTRITPETP